MPDILVLREPQSNPLEAELSKAAYPGTLALEATSDTFTEALSHGQQSGAIGAIVTGRLRVDAARAAERFFTVRHAVGVANVLVFKGGVFGQNTEVPGFIEPISDLEPGTALLLGAGTGARMAAMGLATAGWKVRVWNRTTTKSRVLASSIATTSSVELLPNPDPSGCSLIINATSLGKRPGESPPLDWSRARPKTVVYDLVWRNVPTEFLRAAALRGFRTVDGRESIVAAVALGLQAITGETFDRVPLRARAGLKI